MEMQNITPRIIISRTDPAFLARLMEMEVPEIFDGLITIKSIVREPGERAKVAVESYDDRIDPVGACVGMKGSRIHGIVRELRNESIDVINYTNNLELFIQRAMSPARVVSLEINKETMKVNVFLKPDQVSLAIGKGGIISDWPLSSRVMKLTCSGMYKKMIPMLIWMNFQTKLRDGFLTNSRPWVATPQSRSSKLGWKNWCDARNLKKKPPPRFWQS